MSAATSKEKPRGKRRAKSRALQAVEYFFARLGVWSVRHLPPRAACRFASGLASLAFLCLPRRRRIAVGNVLRAGLAPTPSAARRIARDSFRSFALTVVESFLFHRLPDAWDRIEVEMPEATRAALDASRCGFICYSGHLGNWEVGAQFLTRLRPVTGIARRMDNPRVQALMEASQMRADFETIDKHSSRPMDMVRALKRDRALAILSDQHASGDSAVVIDFFGRPAATYATPAVLQQLTGAPIVFSYAARTGFMRFHVRFSEPLFYTVSKESKAADIQAATQDLSRHLEAAIRTYPDQYLWAHRRWKYAERLEAGKQ